MGPVRESECGVAGVQLNLTYRREMFPGDLIEITTRLLEIGERSVRFLHEMRTAPAGIGRPKRDRIGSYPVDSGSSAVSRVPPPAGLSISNRPPSAITRSAIPTRP